MKLESLKSQISEHIKQFHKLQGSRNEVFPYKVKIKEVIRRFQVSDEFTDRFSEMTEMLWPVNSMESK